jgi:hypothetical protein
VKRAVWALAVALTGNAFAAAPACVLAPPPAFAAVGTPPSVTVWKEDAARWTPPACLGWPEGKASLVVALAASFRHDGDAASLLARLGAISTLRGLRYWSVRDAAWRSLVVDAAALSEPRAGSRRADFATAEMQAGAELFFEQHDNRSSSPVVYRMRVLEAGAERIVVETENVSAVRTLLVTLFPPGALRGASLVERRAPGVWHFYGVSWAGAEASPLAGLSEASYVNRAAALYRHFIGVASDGEPPLAP